MSNPAWEQIYNRWRNDDGSETTATWKAAENADIIAAFSPTGGETYRARLRTTLSLTVANDTINDFTWFCSQNGGAYSQITTTPGTIPVTIVASSNYVDGANTTRQLTLVNTFDTTNAGMDEDGAIGAQSFTKNYSIEIETCLLFGTGCRPGDTFDFKIYRQQTTAYMTWTRIPRLTVIYNDVKNLIMNVG